MSSTVIPREKLSAYQRWELNSFDGGAAAQPATPQTESRPDPRSQREGYEAGYREGVLAAKADVTRAAAAQTARLAEIVGTLSRNMAQLDTEIADRVLDLGITLARRIVGESLAVRPELMLGVVREALQMLGQSRTPSRLLLNPADAKLVREHLGEQCTASGWTVAEDPAIPIGGCRLESAGGELDATLQTRWQRLLSAFGRDGNWLA